MAPNYYEDDYERRPPDDDYGEEQREEDHHRRRSFHKIESYMTQAILVTLCCCLPLGIPAIVFAAQVDGKTKSGDYAGAQAAADKAKMFCLLGLILGLIANGIGVIVRMQMQNNGFPM